MQRRIHLSLPRCNGGAPVVDRPDCTGDGSGFEGCAMMLDDPDLEKLIADEIRALERGFVEAPELYSRTVARARIHPAWVANSLGNEEALAIRLWDLKHGMLNPSTLPPIEELLGLKKTPLLQ